MDRTICILISLASYLSQDTFDIIPIAVDLLFGAGSLSLAGRPQPRRSIDETDRIVNELFRAELIEEHPGWPLDSSNRVVHGARGSLRIDGRTADTARHCRDRYLVNRNVIRVCPPELP